MVFLKEVIIEPGIVDERDEDFPNVFEMYVAEKVANALGACAVMTVQRSTAWDGVVGMSAMTFSVAGSAVAEIAPSNGIFKATVDGKEDYFANVEEACASTVNSTFAIDVNRVADLWSLTKPFHVRKLEGNETVTFIGSWVRREDIGIPSSIEDIVLSNGVAFPCEIFNYAFNAAPYAVNKDGDEIIVAYGPFAVSFQKETFQVISLSPAIEIDGSIIPIPDIKDIPEAGKILLSALTFSFRPENVSESTILDALSTVNAAPYFVAQPDGSITISFIEPDEPHTISLQEAILATFDID